MALGSFLDLNDSVKKYNNLLKQSIESKALKTSVIFKKMSIPKLQRTVNITMRYYAKSLLAFRTFIILF